MPRIKHGLIGRLPRYRGRLLKTSQTTQYASELDDGYYEKGLAKRYEILTTGQHSGVCEFDLDGKTETQSHNCVRDLVTGLMWARYTSAESASVGPGTDGKMAWTGTGDDIFAYCAAANVAELGGYDDWRIPNDAELKCLLDMGGTDVLPDSTAFPDWPASNVWVSTTLPNSATFAFFVRFDDGYAYVAAKTTAYFAALVRGGV